MASEYFFARYPEQNLVKVYEGETTAPASERKYVGAVSLSEADLASLNLEAVTVEDLITIQKVSSKGEVFADIEPGHDVAVILQKAKDYMTAVLAL